MTPFEVSAVAAPIMDEQVPVRLNVPSQESVTIRTAPMVGHLGPRRQPWGNWKGRTQSRAPQSQRVLRLQRLPSSSSVCGSSKVKTPRRDLSARSAPTGPLSSVAAGRGPSAAVAHTAFREATTTHHPRRHIAATRVACSSPRMARLPVRLVGASGTTANTLIRRPAVTTLPTAIPER